MDSQNKEHTLKKVMVLGAIAVVMVSLVAVNNQGNMQQASGLRSQVAQNAGELVDENNIQQMTDPAVAQIMEEQNQKMLVEFQKVVPKRFTKAEEAELKDPNPNPSSVGPQFYVSKPKLTTITDNGTDMKYSITYNVFSGSQDLYFNPWAFRNSNYSTPYPDLRTENNNFKLGNLDMNHFNTMTSSSLTLSNNITDTVTNGYLLPANSIGTVKLEETISKHQRFSGMYSYLLDNIMVYDIATGNGHFEPLQSVPTKYAYVDLLTSYLHPYLLSDTQNSSTQQLYTTNGNAFYGLGFSKNITMEVSNNYYPANCTFSSNSFPLVVKNEGALQRVELGSNVTILNPTGVCGGIFKIYETNTGNTIFNYKMFWVIK